MIRRAFLAALALAASTLGCDPPPVLQLQAITAPPPLAHAELATNDSDEPTLTLTKGVAFALACWDPGGESPCTGVTTQLSFPSVASVSQAYLGFEESGLVIIGLEAGVTHLSIHANEGSTNLDVTIVEH